MLQNNRRSRAWVQNDVQQILGKRMAVHWCLFLATTVTIAVFLRWLAEGFSRPISDIISTAIQENLLVVLVVIALLPWFIRDTLRQSLRFSGPIIRLRRAMRDLASGNDSGPLVFRKGDYWFEIADDFNQLRHRVVASNAPEGMGDEASRSKVTLVETETKTDPAMSVEWIVSV